MPEELYRTYVGDFIGKNRGERMVYGLLTGAKKDIDEQGCDPEWLKAELPEWMKRGNIREMHQLKAVGKGKKLVQGETGDWYLAGKVISDDAWKLVDEDVYTGWSIGIKHPVVVPDARFRNGLIKGGKIIEVSLADYPSYGGSTLSQDQAVYPVLKAAGGKLQGALAAPDMLVAPDTLYKAPTAADNVPMAFSHGYKQPTMVAPRTDPFIVKALMMGVNDIAQDLVREMAAYERKWEPADRALAEREGRAMTHGRLPIHDETDLKNAIALVSSSKDAEAMRTHLITQAARLKRTELLPTEWNSKEAHVENVTPAATEAAETKAAEPTTTPVTPDSEKVGARLSQATIARLQGVLTAINGGLTDIAVASINSMIGSTAPVEGDGVLADGDQSQVNAFDRPGGQVDSAAGRGTGGIAVDAGDHSRAATAGGSGLNVGASTGTAGGAPLPSPQQLPITPVVGMPAILPSEGASPAFTRPASQAGLPSPTASFGGSKGQSAGEADLIKSPTAELEVFIAQQVADQLTKFLSSEKVLETLAAGVTAKAAVAEVAKTTQAQTAEVTKVTSAIADLGVSLKNDVDLVKASLMDEINRIKGLPQPAKGIIAGGNEAVDKKFAINEGETPVAQTPASAASALVAELMVKAATGSMVEQKEAQRQLRSILAGDVQDGGSKDIANAAYQGRRPVSASPID